MTRVRRLSWKNVEVRTKLLCSIVGIIVLIMAGILMSVNFVVTKGLHNNKRESIGKTIGFLEWHIEGESQELEKYVQFLVNDAALKEAINACLFTEEFGEVAALCEAKRKDLGVDRITIYEPVGETKCRLIASSGGGEATGEESALTKLQKEALKKGTISSPICEEGACKIEGYGVIKKRENVVAYVAVTKVLGTNFAKKIEVSTGAKVVIIKHDRADTGKVIMAESADMIGKDISNKLIGEVASTQETLYMSGYEHDGKSHMAVFKPMLDRANEPIGILMSLIDMEDVIKVKHNIAFALLTSAVIALAIGVVLAFFIARSIRKPIVHSVTFAKSMSEGDFTQTIDIDQEDEIGVLVGALKSMASNLGKMFKEVATGVQTLASSATELSSLSEQMSSGAESMSGKSNGVASSSEEMSSNMNSVAASTDQASTNVEMIATAAEEMTSTISEVAKNSEKARAITGEAVSQAKGASERVNELGKAAEEIGKVTQTINEISEQTNLLALNATIEAARAGEAGKGFAVVANEIKELARQTAVATEEIKKEIEGIQASTAGTVTEIGQISKVINDVNEIVSTIAAAVEEQASTTKEIATNVAQASSGIQEVNKNVAGTTTVSSEIAKDIAEVNQAAGDVSNSSSQLKLSAEELSKLAEQLKETVGQFKF